jgi:hypothetical protein
MYDPWRVPHNKTVNDLIVVTPVCYLTVVTPELADFT